MVVASRSSMAAASPADTTCPASSCMPPALLDEQLLTAPGSFYYATQAELGSLRQLESLAISTVLADHHLPASDATAVQSWGRSDAEAELWGQLTKAIRTAPGQRTTDQQNAADWFGDVMRRKTELAADNAGWEFLKWAGIVSGTAPEPTHNEILSLLAQANSGALVPVAFNSNPATSKPTSGYCVYQPPNPMQAQYSGNISTPPASSTAAPWCYAPYRCLDPLGCNNNEPTFDQFVAWGEADSDAALTDPLGYAISYYEISLSQGFAIGAVGAGVAAGIGLASALVPLITGTAVPAAMFPVLATLQTVNDRSRRAVVPASAEVLAASAAATIAGAVAVVIAAIAVAVLKGIELAASVQLPGKLSQFTTDAANAHPDFGAMLDDPTAGLGMYGAFIGATLPVPSLTTCTSSAIKISQRPTVPCLNAPAIPPPSFTDAQFLITPEGSAAATRSDDLQWTEGFANTVNGTTTFTQHDAQLRGTWLADNAVDPSGTHLPEIQVLHFTYIDWNLLERTAWIIPKSGGGYEFVTMATTAAIQMSKTPTSLTAEQMANCKALLLCTVSDTVQYLKLDSGGKSSSKYTAGIADRTPPALNIAVPTAAEGAPASYSVTSSVPLTYQWYFRSSKASGFCSSGDSFCGYAGPYTGPSVSYTWPKSGYFDGILVASDAGGRQSLRPFSTKVLDVPPSLAASGSSVTFPSRSTVSGTVTHAGAEDSGSLTVSWGDQTVETATWDSANPIVNSPDSVFEFTTPSATVLGYSVRHTYSSPGVYVANVRVTDEAGVAKTTSVDEHVLASSNVAVTASPSSANVGDTVTYTAVVTTGGGVRPTGDVTFVDGTEVLCEHSTVGGSLPYMATCGTALTSAGVHAIQAAYNSGGSADIVLPSTSPQLLLPVGRRLNGLSFTSLPPNPAVVKSSYRVSVVGSPFAPPAVLTIDPASTGSACTIVGALVSFRHVGTCVIDADQAQTADTAAGHAAQIVTVTKAAQSITLTPLNSPALIGTGQSLVASSRSGAVVTFDVDPSSTPGSCSIHSQVLSFTAAGSCVVDANAAGDDSYLAAVEVQRQVEVIQVPTQGTLSLSPASSVFGQEITAEATMTGTKVGTVQFTVDGHSVGEPETLNAAGSAITPALTGPSGEPLAPGTHVIDAIFRPSDAVTYASATAQQVLRVSLAATTTTLFVRRSTLSATVRPAAPGAGSPSGSVVFTRQGVVLGSALLSSGVATLTYATSAGIENEISATFEGDGDFQASSALTASFDPIVSADVSASDGKSSYGWYRTPVTVSFRCLTLGAALTEPCPAPVTLDADGSGQSVSRTVNANNGGVGTTVVTGIDIDRDAPSVRIVGVSDGDHYVLQPPSASCAGSDALSGIATCTLTEDTVGNTTTYVATAIDKAGNAETVAVTATRSAVQQTSAPAPASAASTPDPSASSGGQPAAPDAAPSTGTSAGEAQAQSPSRVPATTPTRAVNPTSASGKRPALAFTNASGDGFSAAQTVWWGLLALILATGLIWLGYVSRRRSRRGRH